jgi:hypothetical protein
MAAAAEFVAVRDTWLEAVTPVIVTVSVALAVVVREPTKTPFPAVVAVAAFPPMLRAAAVPVRPVPGPVNWLVAVTVVPVTAAGVVLPRAAGTAHVLLSS